jgi:hypothetical protein
MSHAPGHWAGVPADFIVGLVIALRVDAASASAPFVECA